MIKYSIRNVDPFAALVFFAASLAFLPSLWAGFFWDTYAASQGEALLMLSMEHGFYRPLFNMALIVENFLWNGWSPGYHLTNLVLHSMNAVLLYVIARRVLSGRGPALLASLLFALHPLQVEAVTWVFSLPLLMGGFFSLGTVVLYQNYLRDKELPAAVAGALVALLAMLATQTSLAVLVILMVHVWFSGAGKREAFSVSGLYGIALLAYVAIFLGAGELNPPEGVSISSALEAMTLEGYSFMKLVAPFPVVALPVAPKGILYTLASLLILAFVYVLRTEGLRKEASILGLVFVLILPAAVYALWASDYPIGYRFLYLPVAAFSLLVALVVARIRPAVAYKVVASVLVVACAAGSVVASVRWADRTVLWADAVNARPESVSPLVNLAATLASVGDYGRAELAIEHALSRNGISLEHFINISKLYGRMGQDGEERIYDALKKRKGEALAEYGMGFIYYKTINTPGMESAAGGETRLQAATRHLERAVVLSPEHLSSHYYLGLIYFQEGLDALAKAEFGKVLELDENGRYRPDVLAFLEVIDGLEQFDPDEALEEIVPSFFPPDSLR